ncbi:HD domain-containing protein [Streptomyces sp. NPDC005722]
MEVSFGGAVSESAYRHVRFVLQPAILNHSVRVWLLADHLGRKEGIEGQQREALAVACLFHDAGTAEAYDGPQRFEVEGADAAKAFLGHEGWPEHLGQKVWEAIALHTSPGIAERMGTLPRLVRLAVMSDFGTIDPVAQDEEPLASLLKLFPRMGIETALGDTVVQQALRSPEKAPHASWPASLLAAHLANPQRTGVNPAF